MAYSVNNSAGKVVQDVITDLAGLVAVAVVDINSGMSLASHSNSPAINPDTATAYNTEVVKRKQKQKAMSALKLTGETIQDILITLSNQMHLIRLNDAGSKFIYLVVNSRDTNLAIAREVLRTHANQLG